GAKKQELEKKYTEVSMHLAEVAELGRSRFDEKAFVAEYAEIQQQVNEVRKQQRTAQEAYQAEQARQRPLEEELENLLDDQRKIETEINRLAKQELNVELYQQAESFFSNLEIKVCPHCEIEVSESKKVQERASHTCSLCGETPTEQKID